MSYLFGSGLDVPVVDSLGRLGHGRGKPAEPLGQSRHGILLHIIEVWQCGLVPLARPWRVSKPSVLASLVGVEAIRPRSIVGAQLGKVAVVDLDLASRSTTLALGRPAQRRGRPRSRLGGCRRGLLFPRHVFPALDLAAQPLLPLLADLAAVSLRDGRVLPGNAHHLGGVVRFEEVLPALVTAQSHSFDLAGFEGVHGDAADEGDVDAEAAVDASAGEADEDAELGRRPLR